MGRKNDERQEHVRWEGWSSACQLYEQLAAGASLVELPPSGMRLNVDEIPYADTILGYSRFYGMDVTYHQNSLLLFGPATFVAAGLAVNAMTNASARRRANAMAAAQWRDHAHVRTLLSNRRLLCDYGGQWLSFWHEGVVELRGDVSQWQFVLRYEVGDPLMLHGPAAPWFAVAVAHVVYGPRGLQLPMFSPLAHAVAQALVRRGYPTSGMKGSSWPAALPPA
jgi:hypothetical protein